MDPYSTHQALLVAAMSHSSGDILELGGGWYSTPLVTAFSEADPSRKSYTIETGEYVFGILRALGTERHQISLMPGFDFDHVGKFAGAQGVSKATYLLRQQAYLSEWWDQYIEARNRDRLSLVFVDHAPGFLRVPAIRFFADKADYLITHDTEHVEHYGFEPTLSEFRSRWDFRLHRPNSSILSNFKPCDRFSFLSPNQ